MVPFIRAGSGLLLTLFLAVPAIAEGLNTCSVQLAVSSLPVDYGQSVAFNVGNGYGINKSLIIKGGSAPQTLDRLICTDMPYMISATVFTTASNDLMPPVGECLLKAGEVILNAPNNSVAVVFPNDFICP